MRASARELRQLQRAEARTTNIELRTLNTEVLPKFSANLVTNSAPPGNPRMIPIHRVLFTVVLFLVTSLSAADAPASNEHRVINGTFAEADAQGFPTGWRCPKKVSDPDPAAGEARSPADAKYEVVKEAKESYLRASFVKGKNSTPIAQVIKVPSFAKQVIIMVKVRGTAEPVTGEPIVGCLLFDAAGNPLNTSHHDDFHSVKKLRARGWMPLQFAYKVAPSSTTARIYLGQLHAVEASFEFKDIEVRFR